jgi:hypothetical protein
MVTCAALASRGLGRWPRPGCRSSSCARWVGGEQTGRLQSRTSALLAVASLVSSPTSAVVRGIGAQVAVPVRVLRPAHIAPAGQAAHRSSAPPVFLLAAWAGLSSAARAGTRPRVHDPDVVRRARQRAGLHERGLRSRARTGAGADGARGLRPALGAASPPAGAPGGPSWPSGARAAAWPLRSPPGRCAAHGQLEAVTLRPVHDGPATRAAPHFGVTLQIGVTLQNFGVTPQMCSLWCEPARPPPGQPGHRGRPSSGRDRRLAAQGGIGRAPTGSTVGRISPGIPPAAAPRRHTALTRTGCDDTPHGTPAVSVPGGLLASLPPGRRGGR